MLRFEALIVGAVLCASVGPVAGQPGDDVEACRSAKEVVAGVIDACSRAIQDTSLSRPVRAKLTLRRAWLYNRSRQRDLALQDYTTALDLDLANVEARTLRGLSRAGRGEFEGALADYDELVRLRPDDPEGYRGRGDVRLMQRDFDRAAEDYRKAVAKGGKVSLQQCLISASWTAAFFHCTGVAYDTAQPASSRAEARARIDRMRGK